MLLPSLGDPDVVVYNASAWARGPVAELVAGGRAAGTSGDQRFWRLPGRAQQAGTAHAEEGQGNHSVHPGASASVKGYPQSALFASRASLLCAAWRKAWHASWRRRAIHVAHFVIDGGISSCPPAQCAGQARQFPRPRCDRRQLSPRAAPAAQRLDLGDRALRLRWSASRASIAACSATRAGGNIGGKEEVAMLSEERNRVLTQVGPGTPMGGLLRRYWMPIAGATEFDETQHQGCRPPDGRGSCPL